MKNKIQSLISAIAFGMATLASANTDVGTFTLASGTLVQGGNNYLQIDEGFKATIIGYSVKTGDDVPSNYPEQSHIKVDLIEENTEIEFIEGVGVVENMTFTGPVSFHTEPIGNQNTLATVTIKVERATLPVDFIPNNSVVIPSDSSGNVEIVLERSTDLINWEEATPGQVGSGHDGMFFRIRVKQN